ncbi:hypothetical protein C8R45DRAFT_1043859 [Mycena sanguinolenta]|nr:hypothetical protein C8R45DRAFT_1043859 [Mycena sanguinolenta]
MIIRSATTRNKIIVACEIYGRFVNAFSVRTTVLRSKRTQKGSKGDVQYRPCGRSFRHYNQFESDSSATRCDSGECGDNYTVDFRASEALLDIVETGDPTQAVDIPQRHSIASSHLRRDYTHHCPIFRRLFRGAPRRLLHHRHSLLHVWCATLPQRHSGAHAWRTKISRRLETL